MEIANIQSKKKKNRKQRKFKYLGFFLGYFSHFTLNPRGLGSTQWPRAPTHLKVPSKEIFIPIKSQVCFGIFRLRIRTIKLWNSSRILRVKTEENWLVFTIKFNLGKTHSHTPTQITLCLFHVVKHTAFNLAIALALANGKEKNKHGVCKEKYFPFHLMKLISSKYQAAWND